MLYGKHKSLGGCRRSVTFFYRAQEHYYNQPQRCGMDKCRSGDGWIPALAWKGLTTSRKLTVSYSRQHPQTPGSWQTSASSVRVPGRELALAVWFSWSAGASAAGQCWGTGPAPAAGLLGLSLGPCPVLLKFFCKKERVSKKTVESALKVDK